MTDALFTPLQVGRLTLRNRIGMAPMTRQFSPGGVPGPDVARYYRRRAEGGAGLIVTEGTGIDDPAALDSPSIPVMYGEAALEGWAEVVAGVHAGRRDLPAAVAPGRAARCPQVEPAEPSRTAALRPVGPGRQALAAAGLHRLGDRPHRADDRARDRRRDRRLWQGGGQCDAGGVRRHRHPCRTRLPDRHLLVGRDQPADGQLGRRTAPARPVRRRGGAGDPAGGRARHSDHVPLQPAQAAGLSGAAGRDAGRAGRDPGAAGPGRGRHLRRQHQGIRHAGLRGVRSQPRRLGQDADRKAQQHGGRHRPLQSAGGDVRRRRDEGARQSRPAARALRPRRVRHRAGRPGDAERRRLGRTGAGRRAVRAVRPHDPGELE